MTPNDFAERLRSARDAKGLRLDDAAYLARQLLPPAMAISRETVRRYEKGRVPETDANPLYVAALAVVYEVSTSDLSEHAAEGVDRVFGVLVSLNPALAHSRSEIASTKWYYAAS